MGDASTPLRERGLPEWLKVGLRVRVVANSNQHDYHVGQEYVVTQLEPARSAFRARHPETGVAGNWLVCADIVKLAELGWSWLRSMLAPEDVTLLEAFEGLDELELKDEVKAELIKRVADLKGAILAAARSE